ncbi:MAG: WGR domain-containing protein [Candidatus Thorarchaeota archaeon]
MTEEANNATSIRYEFNDQFWQGVVERKFVHLHFGKIGTSGHKATREFPSAKAAIEFLEMRLKDKIEEGFRKAQ